MGTKWETIVFKTLTDWHQEVQVPPPAHPLISLVDFSDMTARENRQPRRISYNFYKVSFVEQSPTKMKYGQRAYDLTEGGLCFISPNQLLTDDGSPHLFTGMALYFHADLIAKHPLVKKIKQYGFFSYSVAEALQVSGKERETIISIFKQIEEELQSPIDAVSDEILISYIELLLNFGDRFYSRQFLTRKVANNDLVAKVEYLLTTWFEEGNAQQHGLPTVQLLSKQLHLSPDYLSDMLRAYTGQNTQQHIHNKLIEKARELLSNTSLSTAEVAYALGFEHPQSFNKLFKQKTLLSPMEFRETFN
ncbi:AraC family transcriptional regulator [Niastella yeongjuensis]|uniref:AraC family transcriptional regulator n=1 Tax=Niastella yeongjuensis TaxID=354355 RepID=A0A1V9E412_9BACT|nr:AraC family transcriptional regulator [Niastella yeongjuensis]OQP40836.1 AraC family transcriptional regulator [Niastella yeongjuensis]SEP00130.1 Helix-turn-helix domain-containing protein [Niastella yeongjuensis]